MIKATEKYVFYFMIYCVLGWVYEMIICMYNLGHLEDRSQLIGPFCPIYGFGASVMVLLFHKDSFLRGLGKNRVAEFVIVFIGIMIASTVMELIGSYVSEALSGGFMWDYSRFKIQYDSRIALLPSFRFAVAGTFVIYAIHPWVDKLVDALSDKWLRAGAIVILLFFVANMAVCKMM